MPHALVNGHMRVMVLWAVPLVVGDVQVHTVVSRLWYPVPIVLQWLMDEPVSTGGSAIRASTRCPPSDLVPPLSCRPRSRRSHSTARRRRRGNPGKRGSQRSTRATSISLRSAIPAIPGEWGPLDDTGYNRTWGAAQFAPTHHDWCNGHESVIHPPRLVEIPRLERDLETAASHSKRHGVHVDVRRARSRFGGSYVSQRDSW